VTQNWNSRGAKIGGRFGEIRAQFWLYLEPFHSTYFGTQFVKIGARFCQQNKNRTYFYGLRFIPIS